MSKKKMLEESQIRRMFQLAGMPAIGEGFIGGKYSKLAEEEEGEEEKEELDEKAESEEEESDDKNEGMKYSREEEEEEPVEEGGMKYSREEEGEGEEEPAPEMDAAEEPAPEMDMGAEPAAAEGDIPAEKIEAIVDAVLAGIEKETGVPLERVEGEGGEEAPAEEPPVEEPEMAMGGEEDEMALENNFSDKVIEEVSLRVARRLIQLTKK
tara:strand:+ start:6487 stop:7116 length:630 start_codon:yes stop_codon:yes gene_type:complete